jgi:molybdopterin converting factor small subunit
MRDACGGGWYAQAMSERAVTVRLFAGLERQAGDGRAERSVPRSDAPSIEALLALLGLEGRAGLVLVNGVHAALDRALEPGDEVDLFPPVGGG